MSESRLFEPDVAELLLIGGYLLPDALLLSLDIRPAVYDFQHGFGLRDLEPYCLVNDPVADSS